MNENLTSMQTLTLNSESKEKSETSPSETFLNWEVSSVSLVGFRTKDVCSQRFYQILFLD